MIDRDLRKVTERKDCCGGLKRKTHNGKVPKKKTYVNILMYIDNIINISLAYLSTCTRSSIKYLSIYQTLIYSHSFTRHYLLCFRFICISLSLSFSLSFSLSVWSTVSSCLSLFFDLSHSFPFITYTFLSHTL